MAIRVGHGVNAGAVAGAAFGGAQGQARSALTGSRLAAAERERLRRLQLQQEAQQADLQRQFSAQRQERGFEFGQIEADAAQQRTQQNMRLNSELQGGLASEAFDRSQTAADAQQLRGREDLEYSLTTRQRMELDQLAEAEASAMRDPSFSPQEKDELKYRFAQRRAGITPVARPKPQTPAELFQQRTHTDPRTGRVYALDENGMPGRAIYEPPEKQATVQDRVKAWSEALKAAATAEGGVDEGKAKRFYEMIMSGNVPEDFGAPAAGGSPGSPVSMSEIANSFGTLTAPEQKAPGLFSSLFGSSGPDLNTFEGVGQRIAEINSPKVDRGAIDPGDATNLATLDYQLRVARELRARHDDAFAQAKAEQDPSHPKFKEWRATEFEPWTRVNRDSAKRVSDRIDALEKRRDAVIAQKDELEALLLASQIRQQGGR